MGKDKTLLDKLIEEATKKTLYEFYKDGRLELYVRESIQLDIPKSRMEKIQKVASLLRDARPDTVDIDTLEIAVEPFGIDKVELNHLLRMAIHDTTLNIFEAMPGYWTVI